MKSIGDIIESSLRDIKKILLEEAGKIETFPKSSFGVREPKHSDKTPIIAEGMFGPTPDLRNRGIVRQKEGILVYNNGEFWTDRLYIFMLPNGLYRFSASMFKDSEEGSFSQSYPDWDRKKEVSEDYFVYGQRALDLMKKIETVKVK